MPKVLTKQSTLLTLFPRSILFTRCVVKKKKIASLSLMIIQGKQEGNVRTFLDYQNPTSLFNTRKKKKAYLDHCYTRNLPRRVERASLNFSFTIQMQISFHP